MRLTLIVLVLLAAPSVAAGQNSSASSSYQPAVPPPSMGGYGGGGYGYNMGAGTTVGGSYMTGMANVISAQGDYNLSTSAAAVNMTQAEKQEIQNRQQYTNTYFEMRETNRNARAAERGSQLSVEQLSRLAHDYAPKPLGPNEIDDLSGKVHWPARLQTNAYAADRNKFESLFGSYSQLGVLSAGEQDKARIIINNMAKTLKSQIRSIHTSDYTTCKDFLQSLLFTTCKCRLS